MKKLVVGMLTIMVLALAGCGGGHESDPPPFVTQILSDPLFDGYIAQDTTGALTVTPGMTQSVFAGIDPVTGEEFRAFLDFPLTGAGGVPGDAVIQSAFLDIFIDSLALQTLDSALPIRIDLVSFQPPSLLATDFDLTLQPPLASISIAPPISQRDARNFVVIDVTPLMIKAQQLRLPDFQVRILEDFGPVSPGLMEIADPTVEPDRTDFAPLLEVRYF